MIYAAILLVGYLGICWLLARTYISPIRSTPVLPVGLEEIRVPSPAGEVPTWSTPDLGKGRALFVMAHGYGGDRATWGPLMVALHQRGFDALAPSMPGQDASPDPTVGFGAKEARLMVEVARWARGRYSKPPKVVMVGLSMGGAAAWLASELDPSVHAVATEGAYARFDEAMNGWFEANARGSSVYLRPVVWIAQLRSGLNPATIVPEAAAAKWAGRPSLIVHGDDDRLIPPSHARRLAAASGGELWLVPGASHADVQNAAFEEYVDKLVELAERDW